MSRRQFAATLGMLPFAPAAFTGSAFARDDDWPAPGFMPLPEVAAFVQAEHTRWDEVIRAAGIEPQ